MEEKRRATGDMLEKISSLYNYFFLLISVSPCRSAAPALPGRGAPSAAPPPAAGSWVAERGRTRKSALAGISHAPPPTPRLPSVRQAVGNPRLVRFPPAFTNPLPSSLCLFCRYPWSSSPRSAHVRSATAGWCSR
jgi:hypothetical protein